MTFDDFRAWIIQQQAQGWQESTLLKMARISIVRHKEAAERWVRLEVTDPGKSAPFWLNEHEARKIAGALKGQRGTELRLLRQQLEALFDE